MSSRYIPPAPSRDNSQEPVPDRLPTPPVGKEAILLFYGDPLSYKTPDMYWRANGAFAFVNKEAYSHIPTLRTHSGFWCHRKLKAVFEEVFQEIADLGLAHLIESFDGVYNHRVIRGGERLSLHAFGAAIDLNAGSIPLGSEKRMDPRVVDCFTKRGFTYGGDYKGRKDGMHYEYGCY